MDTKLANKEHLKRRAASARYLVSKIATAFNVEAGEALQAIYIQELMKLEPGILDTAVARTIREWDKPSMMPPLAFILERAVAPLPDGNAQLDREWNAPAVHCDMCGGNGQLAVFFEETMKDQQFKREFRKVMPYSESQGFTGIPPKWIRFYFRCTCAAGDRRPIGLPRWTEKVREVA